MFRIWEFLLVQERSSTHWATWNKSPSLCQQVADGYSPMLWSYTTKESHPTQLLHHAASYLPFPDLTHRVLQVDILIKGALAWEWEEIVRGRCFSVRMGYRRRSPTCETWHCRSAWCSDVVSLSNLPQRCFSEKTLIRSIIVGQLKKWSVIPLSNSEQSCI